MRSTIIGSLSSKNSGGSSPEPPPSAPVNTVLPVVSGTEKVGETLSSTTGTWINSPTSYSYQWKRDGSNISGATSSTYLLTTSDFDTVITCAVTATNAGGSTAATSNATGAILPIAPVNTAIPVITGGSTAADILTCSTGTFIGQGTISYTYQWRKDGVNIGGQTANTYDVQVSDEDSYIDCVVTATNTGGPTSATANSIFITDPSLSAITADHVYSGSDRMMLYIPGGYSNNADDYPVVIFYPGNGERGTIIDVNDLIGTGNGSQTGWIGNLTNSGRYIIHSTVYVTVNGVQVATGRYGVITGAGVTGTYDTNDSSSAAFSLTFSTAVTNGHQIRIYHTDCEALNQGPFKYLNAGDNPNCIYVSPIISRASGGYEGTEWDNVIAYLVNNGYRVNLNRIYATGLSLGGDMCDWLLSNNNPGATYQWAAYVDVAPGSTAWTPSYNNALWTSAANKGKLYIRATNDTNGASKVPTSMANGNATVRNFPVQAYNYWGPGSSPALGHNANLWDGKVYNRKNRTDATGTADFDYMEEFLFKFSCDAEEQATLFTRYAESTLESEDYRLAKLLVDALSAGATKTALLADLAALKTTIGNSVIIDFGATATSGNVNTVTSAAASTVESNMVDDEGNNTGFSMTIVAATSATPGMTNMGDRMKGRQFGFESNTNVDGMNIDAAGTVGTIKFSGLDNAKTYTLKIYVSNSNNAWTNRAEVQATYGGVTKQLYCDTQNFRYIKFTGLAPSANEISGTISQFLTASYTERIAYLQAMELIEE